MHFPKMERLGNVAWNAILADNFTGSEIYTMLTLCKTIRTTLQNDSHLMSLIRSRHRAISRSTELLHFLGINDTWRKAGKRLWHSYDTLTKKACSSDSHADGFRLLQSDTHVIALSDAYAFNDQEVIFYNMALYLEHELGREVCEVRHLHFRCMDQICLGLKDHRPTSAQPCCEWEVHRGHVIVFTIKKTHCTAKFINTLPCWFDTIKRGEFIRECGVVNGAKLNTFLRPFCKRESETNKKRKEQS
jgi:hypothetical protein